MFGLKVGLMVCAIAAVSGQQNPQRFAIEPSDKTAIVGDTVILPCRVDNKLGTLQWTRDGFGLGTDRNLNGFPRYTMIGTDDEGDFSLQISPVTLEDDALFQCQVGASEGIRGIRSRSAQFTVFVSPEPPVIVQARAHNDVMKTTSGMTVELTCEAHGGKPPAELTWLDWEGNPVTSGISYTTQPMPDGKRFSATLKWTFTANKNFDKKRLTCREENAALKQPKFSHVTIEVRYAPEVTLRSTQSGRTQEGEDVTLECSAQANPSQMSFKWFKDDELIVGENGKRLSIRNVQKEWNGAVVTCEVANSVGTGRDRFTVDVAFGPQFKSNDPQDSEMAAERGHEVRLRCDVEGNPRPEITWLRAGQSIGLGPELVLSEMSTEFIGKYECRARAEGRNEIRRETLVFIKGPPRIRRPYVQYGKEGHAVRVECVVESVPTPQRIVWSKNTRVVDVDNDDGYEIIEEPSLEDSTLRSMILIRNSKLSDFGAYNCSVWNNFGFDSRIITLVQESNFSPLVISVGVVICGIVFIISMTIVAIICLKRKKSFTEDLKKNNNVNTGHMNQNGKHFHTDSGSSGADSDLKAEIRTTSSMSQHYYPDVESNDGKQVVENIYSYSESHNGLNMLNNGLNLAHNGIPFPPMCHEMVANANPNQQPNANPFMANAFAVDFGQPYDCHLQSAPVSHVIIQSPRQSYAAQSVIDPTYGTLRSMAMIANPYLRTSSAVTNTCDSSGHTSGQLSAGMYSMSQNGQNQNQRYITSNGQQSNGQLATHV